MKTWIIYFTDGTITSVAGFNLTKEDAIDSINGHLLYRHYTIETVEAAECLQNQ
jgi:hypothetical protein